MMKPYSISPQQHSAVISSSGLSRYKHFVSRVADYEEVWGLRNDSAWAATGDERGGSGFPVWPHPDYASECAVGEWGDCLPSKIDVHDFVESWLPDMASRGTSVAVFPTPLMHGVMVSAFELQKHIRQELERME